MEWFRERLGEASTWKGIGYLLVAVGLIPMGAVDLLVSAGIAVVGVVDFVRRESR